MKILEQETWSKQYRCEECHSLLEVDQEDILVGDFGVKWGVPETNLELYFKCPVCTSNIFVVEGDGFPSGIRRLMIDEWWKKDRQSYAI